MPEKDKNLAAYTGGARESRTGLVSVGDNVLGKINAIKQHTGMTRDERRKFINEIIETAIEIDST